MTTITATSFKTNFKHFGNLVSKGERLLIKRPQREPNLIVLNENDYKEMNRLLEYYQKLVANIDNSSKSQSFSDAPNNKRSVIGIAKGKISYPDDFDEMNETIAMSFYNYEE